MKVSFLWPTLPVYTFESGVDGPTALIQGGIHGDEIAGVHALEEMLEDAAFRPVRGKIVVIPRMNPPAVRARTRMVTGGLDLNRVFPGDAGAERFEKRLAAALFGLVLELKPALVATLHESKKRYDPAYKSYGQTIVYGVDPRPRLVDEVLERMNAECREGENWSPLYDPIPTSSTEQIVAATGCVGVTVETWMGFGERRRIEMQRRVVEVLLERIGVV